MAAMHPKCRIQIPEPPPRQQERNTENKKRIDQVDDEIRAAKSGWH
jgi:hypothetical protein